MSVLAWAATLVAGLPAFMRAPICSLTHTRANTHTLALLREHGRGSSSSTSWLSAAAHTLAHAACDNAALEGILIQGDDAELGARLRSHEYVFAPVLLNSEGLALLHTACYLGDTQAIVHLINAGTPVDLPAANGQTCLSFACESAHTHVLQLIAQLRPDVNARGFDDCPAIMLAMREMYRPRTGGGHPDALGDSYRGVLHVLLRMGANVNAACKGIPETGVVPSSVLRDPTTAGFGTLMYPTAPVHLAAAHGDVDTIRLLLGAGASVDLPNAHGTTALMMAAHSGHVDAMQVLVEAGADIEAQTRGGFRPLSLAASAGKSDAVALLMAANADPSVEVHDGQRALHLAAKKGCVDCVARLLSTAEGREQLEVRAVHGHTPLLLACSERQVDVMRALLQAGADAHAKAQHSLTCLMLAVGVPASRWKITKELAHDIMDTVIGGDTTASSLELDAVSSVGVPALVMAMRNGQEDFAIELLERGANPAISLPDGTSAAHILEQVSRTTRMPRLATLLREKLR